MSYGTFDTISHILATLFLISRIAETPFEPFVATAVEAIAAEHKLRVCGSVAAAAANLRDTLAAGSGREKECFKHGYKAILGKIEEWQLSHDLPSPENCSVVILLDGGQVEVLQTELYQLDGDDAPKRRVNWNYRITSSLRGI